MSWTWSGSPASWARGIGTDLVEGTVTLPVISPIREGDARSSVGSSPIPTLAGVLEAGIEAVLGHEAVARTEARAAG
jgi:hypothetical protein